MSKQKFNVGNKVKILDASIDGYKEWWVDNMVGKLCVVLEYDDEEEDYLIETEDRMALWCTGDYLELVPSTVTNELTQRELQVLSAMLKEQIAFYEKVLPGFKEDIDNIFHRCDPENKATSYWFESLNHIKDAQRDFRNRKKKFAEIQRKIKRQIANG